MTRFARAKGSKSSNERTPEDSTPWEVMKDQLLQAKKENEVSKKREEAENQRIENYQNFLKEQKVQKKKASWCDFPETIATQNNNEQPPKKKKKDKHRSVMNQATTEPQSGITNVQEASLQKTKKKNNKKNKPKSDATIKAETESQILSQCDKKLPKKKKVKKSNQFSEQSTDTSSPITEQPPESPIVVQSKNENDLSGQSNNNNNNKKQNKKKKPTKFINGKPVRRKEVNDRSFQLIINGKEVELVRFDGFPIMKKDADRLEDLKKSMIKKGIPKSEVQRTMKLERRRAEKALARMKREVCYNCRKGGHNLSDCPDLKSKIPGVDAAEGVCFKCGSTEHKQFECKVQRDKEFKFATCFICKEPGHIARQCPDNPKGLYPNGGSCKLCGDVTHLRKDCPTVQDKREDSSIKLQTLDNNVEDIGVQVQSKTSGGTPKKPKKIKF